jgi:hypothetical protein
MMVLFNDVEKTATAKTNAGVPIQLRSGQLTKKFERVVRNATAEIESKHVSCQRSEMVSHSHCAGVP